VDIMMEGIGEITESDVMMAQTMKAMIIGFNVQIPKSTQELASIHGVKMKTYKIIYDMLDDIDKQIEFFENPGLDEEEVGTAKIIAEFEIRGDKIAGCHIETGELKRGQNILFHIKRGDAIIADPRVKSLKQGKNDVEVVKAPGECGVVFRGDVAFAIGDTVVCYTKKEII
jgi:translation initiation factor IF-2